MSLLSCDTRTKSKWYNAYVFPLVPIVDTRKADKYNASKFSFRWLFFTMWTLESFAFELSFVADTHWGIGVIGIVPYCRWALTIPCTNSVERFVGETLSRTPKIKNEND